MEEGGIKGEIPPYKLETEVDMATILFPFQHCY